MRRPKMLRRVFYLDQEADTRLTVQAQAHKVTRPSMLRSLIHGYRPGSDPGSIVSLADSLYDRCSPARRVSMMRYHYPSAFARLETKPTTTDDALPIFEDKP